MGVQLFQILTGHQVVGSEDYVCSTAHDPNGAWYQKTPNKLWGKGFSWLLLKAHVLGLTMKPF